MPLWTPAAELQVLRRYAVLGRWVLLQVRMDQEPSTVSGRPMDSVPAPAHGDPPTLWLAVLGVVRRGDVIYLCWKKGLLARLRAANQWNPRTTSRCQVPQQVSRRHASISRTTLPTEAWRPTSTCSKDHLAQVGSPCIYGGTPWSALPLAESWQEAEHHKEMDNDSFRLGTCSRT